MSKSKAHQLNVCILCLNYYYNRKRRKQLAQRRVSFAPDANLRQDFINHVSIVLYINVNFKFRVFNEEDTPDLSTRNIPNITEEAEPTMLMTDVFGSPAYQSTEPR